MRGICVGAALAVALSGSGGRSAQADEPLRAALDGELRLAAPAVEGGLLGGGGVRVDARRGRAEPFGQLGGRAGRADGAWVAGAVEARAADGDVAGRVELRAHAGLGDPHRARDPLGLELEVGAWLEAAPAPGATAPAEIGPAPFVERGGRAELVLRKVSTVRHGLATSFALPLGAEARRVTFAGAGPVAGFDERQLSVGIAAHLRGRDVLAGTIGLLTVTWTERAWVAGAVEARVLPPPPAPAPFQRLEVWLGPTTPILGMCGCERFVVGGVGAIGVAHVTGAAGEADVLVFKDGVVASIPGFALTLMFSRDATTSPDGRALVADWRVEAGTRWEPRRVPVGGALRLSFGALEDVVDDDASVIGRHGMENELYWRRGELSVGAYARTTWSPAGGAAWDPWAGDRRLAFEGGVLVLWGTR
jgi:hypothetical protein